jgi:DNA-binding GntR family transcriptional regulator
MNNLNRVEPRTLKDNVTEILRQSIIDGSLAPGTEFNQAQLAERLGVSRGPIREAVGQLEQEGLIQSIPYKGIVVTPLTPQYVEELYSVRVALETLAIARGIERLQPQHLDLLTKTIDDMRRAARAGDLDSLTKLDLRFHEYLVQMADHALLLRLWKLIEVGVRRCLHTRHKIYTSLDEIVGTHPKLIDAIAERNVALASRTLHEHITEAGEQILENWRRHEAEQNAANGTAASVHGSE